LVEHYTFIRIFKEMNAENDSVDKELKKVIEFIKQRSSVKKNVSYYTITYIDRGDVDGLIVIKSKDEKSVRLEAEIIKDYIVSSMEHLSAKIIDKPRKHELIKIPRSSRFFVEETALN